MKTKQGNRAGATNIDQFALWELPPTEFTSGYTKARAVIRKRYILYVADALPWIFTKDPKTIGLAAQFAFGNSAVGGIVKGVLQLNIDPHLHPGCPGWEMSEIAAIENYGPLIFDLGIAATGNDGVYPDSQTLSVNAKQFFQSSYRMAKYDRVALPPTCGYRIGRINTALTAAYRLHPEPLAITTDWLRTLRTCHQNAEVQINRKRVLKNFGISVDDFGRKVFTTFFRHHYNGARDLEL